MGVDRYRSASFQLSAKSFNHARYYTSLISGFQSLDPNTDHGGPFCRPLSEDRVIVRVERDDDVMVLHGEIDNCPVLRIVFEQVSNVAAFVPKFFEQFNDRSRQALIQ